MTETPDLITVMVVDPGCFTPAYDAELCTALSRQGANVTLVTAPHQNDVSHRFPPGFQLVELFFSWSPLRRLGSLRKFAKGAAYPFYCRRLVRLIEGARPDVLHYQWLPMAPVDLHFIQQIRRRSPGTCLVVTMHDVHVLARGGHGHLHRILALADGIVVHGQDSRTALLQMLPHLRPAKIAVIAHGPLHDAALPRQTADAEPPAPRRHVGLLFGEIKAYKGLDVLADALSLLGGSDKDRLRLVIAGKIEEPRCRGDLDRLGSLGIELDMQLGYVRTADVPGYFQRADFVLLPYKSISQSGVLLSALSHGRLVIASAVGDMTAVVAATGGGYCVAPGDPQALATALRTVLARTPAELRLAGAGARDRLVEAFGWTRIAAATISHYDQCERLRGAAALA